MLTHRPSITLKSS